MKLDKVQLGTLTDFRSVSCHLTCYQLFFDSIVRLVWLPIFCIWTKHDTYICLERSHRLISFIRVKVKSTWKPGRWAPSRTSHDNEMINVADLLSTSLCFWCRGWSSANAPLAPQSHTPALCWSVTVNMLDNCSACFTAQCTVQVHLTMKNDKNIVSPNISASCSNSWGHIYVAAMICLYFRCCHWQAARLFSCQTATEYVLDVDLSQGKSQKYATVKEADHGRTLWAVEEATFWHHV